MRLATPADIEQIDYLDSFSHSPTRSIHREIEKYFGSVDPSTHEYTLIFLAEVNGVACAKAELMLPPTGTSEQVGYVKRVIVHPDQRKQGLSRLLMQHIIQFAREERHIEAIDLIVWESNVPAIQLYESLGFTLQHRELYYRLRI
ncbi:GNAT family N-acetyltransferase [Ktedonospora formicarum]|nr:GNAT family N-acetyltransferase [Ktedonospora formicarum]